jgi:hypothetical protein
MRLELCDEVVSERASEQDIAAALAKVPRDDDWSLLLEAGNDFLLADVGDDQGTFYLQCSRSDEALSARARLDDTQLQTLFASFLNRDDRWRSLCKWRSAAADAPEDEAPYSPSTNRAAGIFGACFVALLFLVALFPDSWLPGWLPPSLQSTGGWLVVLFVLAIPGVLVAATVVKLREVRKASTWPKTIGKIVSSELVSTRRKVTGEATRSVNRPAVRYSYQASGKRFTGSRISIGEIADNDPRIPEILKRYAIGNSVTVYYQPDQPANSVLERDPPVGLHIIWAVVAGLFLIMAGVGSGFLFPDQIKAWFSPYLPDVRHPYLLVIFSTMAGLALLRTIALLFRPKASAGWAAVPGTILTSEVETRQSGARKTSYPHIEYSYVVAGQEYRASRVSAIEISGSDWIVRRRTAKYPAGSTVSVHYNTANPAEATLQPPSTNSGGGLTAVVICGFLAWYFATH